MVSATITYQLVPPHNHRANPAERAIQTFKNHFIAGLCSCDPDFPIREWDRLLPQAEITLNLLQTARANPKLSAYTYLFGLFDFNKTPMAPPGTRVLVHDKPDQRKSWDPRGTDGWYIGPAMEHYRCVLCFMPKTRTVRVSDTVVFFPHKLIFPEVTLADFIRQTVSDLVQLLKNPPSTTAISLRGGDITKNAILDIASLLNRVVTTSTSSTSNQMPPIQSTTNPLRLDHSLPPSPADASPPVLPPLPRVNPISDQPVLSRLPRVAVNEQPTISTQSRSTHHYNLRSTTAPMLLAHHIYNNDGKRESLDSLMTGSHRDIWIQSMSNELGRLAQGNDSGIKYTDTINFIPKKEVPAGCSITYASFVCDYCPTKADKYCIRLVAGGDKLSYDQDPGSPTASLLETKLLINSVISDASKGARFMSCDLKDFFLASPMDKPEYMRIAIKHFPPDIIQRYHIRNIVHDDGYVYVKIKKGMYGLKQAAILAYNFLVQNLSTHGYYPLPHTVGLWGHLTRRTKFCLCVDDFGIKYFKEDDANHLLDSLKHSYNVSVADFTGASFCGLTLKWNYVNGFVDIMMPTYIKDALLRFQHPKLTQPQYSPHPHTPVQYGRKGIPQLAPDDDPSPALNKIDTKYVQSVIGTLLYYARAIDVTMLPALNEIAAAQANPTTNTLKRCKRLLDYSATYPSAFV